ncbi:ubiquitin-like-specific protease 1C [Drosophila subpulchrella]|uniref:ubiquitin-like-specific protease 1C n=1 Tax=Drosophila subpulchrella TaxID=1486046 RepID=UPI0018A17BA3|nr:ubiquitin-like-specific protease 1C [Drosophila subpulchrella]XP_037723455.1 ubiquitin-like-specific protease 1C [Drosophila subpulchrella]
MKMDRILKRRRPLSPIDLFSTPAKEPTPPTTKAVRRIAINDFIIISRQLLINRAGRDPDRRSAKMLVILESFKQYVITFTLPSSSCTVQDLLREMGVEFDERTTIDATEKSEGTFHVVVCVGFIMSEAADELAKSTEKVYNEMHLAKKSEGGAAIAPKMPEPIDLSSKPAAAEDINGNQQAAEAPGCSKKRTHRSSSGNTTSPGGSQFQEQSAESRKHKKHKKSRSSSSKSKDSHSHQTSDRKELPEAKPPASKGNNVSLERNADARKSRKHKKHKKHSSRSSGEKSAVPKDYHGSQSKESCSTGEKPHTSRDNKGSQSRKSKESSSTDENFRIPKVKPGSQLLQSQKSKESSSVDEKPHTSRHNHGSQSQKSKEISSTDGNSRTLKFNFGSQFVRSVKSKRSSSLDEKTHTPKENIITHRLQWPRQSREEVLSGAQFPISFGNKINDFKPRSAFQSWPAASTPGEKPKTPEEKAELSRLRRNRRWILSRDCDDDDDDDTVVLLSSSSEDEETTTTAKKTKQASKSRLSIDENLTLLMYPPTGTGALSIGMKDYMCLSRGSYLNDIIIDFYLRWLKNNVIPEGQRERTHIFSTFFHKRLTTLTRPINAKQSAAQKRHERVQKWTRTVDIFDKDFIIIPFNEQAHWILAIICFPSLSGPVAYDDDDKLSRDGPIKQPVILIFDSLAITSRHRAIAILRDYLTCEYRAKNPKGKAHIFNKDNMPGHRVEVPQQENLTDCGLYLLQYVEQFFTKPIKDYRLPITELVEWFDLLTVTKKREDIANLIQKLMDEGNPQKQRKILPVLEFPTLNGQMVEED